MLSNKKAVSLIVSYVLLISIGLSIAGLVYGWLKFYVDLEEPESCPDGVHVAIIESKYYDGGLIDGSKLSLNLTIQNRGRFNVSGYIIKASNERDLNVGMIPLYDAREFAEINPDSLVSGTFPMAPGSEIEHSFDASMIQSNKHICFIELQPYIEKEGTLIPCSQVSTKIIDCNSN